MPWEKLFPNTDGDAVILRSDKGGSLACIPLPTAMKLGIEEPYRGYAAFTISQKDAVLLAKSILKRYG